MKRLASIILGVVIILGTIGFYRLYQNSSPTPNDAVRKYIIHITSNAPQKVDSVNVVSSTPSDRQGNKQILLFRANAQMSQIHFVGYAIVRKNPFGWNVEKLQMAGKSPLPNEVMANLDWSDGSPVIYGQVFLANATSVEAIFMDPNKGFVNERTEIPEGNFVLFGLPHSELMKFQVLDANGNVLKQFTSDEIQSGQ